MSTMDVCRILTIKHSQALITNMVQKQNEHHEHHGCIWNSDNQALTSFDHKCGTEAMAQKQNEQHGYIWTSDNEALTCCDHKHDTEAE